MSTLTVLKTMNEPDVETVRVAVQRLLDTVPGLTQNQIARESGVNTSRLNQWLKGTYTGNNEGVAADLRRWLDARAEREQAQTQLPNAPAWLETPTARKILATLTYTHMAGGIGAVYGGAGMGKTLTCAEYASRYPNVWHVEIPRYARSMAECGQEIGDAVGLRESYTAPRMYREIVRRLRGSQGLLIIDEAQHLDLNALEAIRGIHDAARIGVALVGNETVYARLTGGRREAEFAQLFRRLGKRQRLIRPEDGDISALCEAWGVAGQAERKLLSDIGGKPGALGGVTQVLRLASMLAVGEGQGVGVAHIRAAWRDLGAQA